MQEFMTTTMEQVFKPIQKALKDGKLVISDIDVQGHRLAREKLNQLITSVFITTPSLQELKRRLRLRNSDSLEIIDRRVENAKYEIKYIDEYDYLIVNDSLDLAVERFITIAKASRLKSSIFNTDEFISEWLDEV